MDKYFSLLSLALVAAMTTVSSAATTTATWNGSTSDDIFEETNWTVSGAASAITVDPGVAWSTTGGNNTIDFVFNAGDFANGGQGVSGEWRSPGGNASANSITLNDATVEITQQAGFIIGSTDFASYMPMVLNGASDLTSRAFYGVDVVLNDSSTWTTAAGTNFLQVSKLDFATLDTRVYSTSNAPDNINWPSTIAKMNVLGQPAVSGVNLLLLPDGSGGTIFVPVPEPSTLALFALGGAPVVLCGIRRRQFNRTRAE